MKYGIVTSLLLAFAILLAGCATKAQTDVLEPASYSLEDMSVFSKKDSQRIYIGMSKDEAEKIAGEPIYVSDLLGTHYEGITLFYREDVVSGIAINSGTASADKYRTSRGLSVGSSLNQWTTLYGNSTITELLGENAVMPLLSPNMVYVFNEQGRLELTDTPATDQMSHTYVISALFDSDAVEVIGEDDEEDEEDDNSLVHILIGDYAFVFKKQ